ncbi:extracellular solute-binding protein [Paenibacillus sp. FA6]|uniref:extracellular solute-binding protein n=1 Tax=Paenibacillus sp. FA6 TaxID=3413029 RepID=UPI003F65974B
MSKKKNAKGLVLLTLAGMLALSACSSNVGNNKNNETPAGSNATGGKDNSPIVETIDINAKYDPPIEVRAWRFTESTYQYENGDTIEDNLYTQTYESDLGIKLKYDWAVPVEQFKQKMNVSIASGDLPDIMWVEAQQLAELAENDLILDLTDLFDQYASPVAKDVLQQDPKGFGTAKIGGKLMAIPHTSSAVDGLPVMYVRTDWLKNLNIEEPKTMQDMIAIAEAFTKNDPDKNSKDDTFGVAFTKTFLTDTHFGTTGFMSGFHAYPTKWVEKDGALVYGSVQPEVKAALEVLQGLYRNGMIDKEFGVKDRAKVTEAVVGGKVGLFYGSMSAPLSIIQDNITNDPSAEWKAFELVSNDEVKATPIAKMPIQKYYVVNKDTKHPEAIFKLLNMSMLGYDPDAVKDPGFGYSESGVAVFLYNFIAADPALKNLTAHRKVVAAIEANDPSTLNEEELGYYEKVISFRAGDNSNWGTDRVFGSPSSFDVIDQYVQKDNYVLDGFYGAATPTMVERNATLITMEEEVFTKIIMGESLEAFDKFVANWNKLGGEQITKEVNEWYDMTK